MQATLSRGVRLARPLVQQQQNRGVATSKGLPQMLYNNVWKKSTISYITYIIVGCVAIEAIYGSVTQSIWDDANKGKQYKSVDWSKFKATEDDDDDEDEDEEDEE